MMTTRRKNIRLSSTIYENPAHIFSIIICTWQRMTLFHNPAYAKTVTASLHHRVFTESTKLYAYCLMPDHLHLLISPKAGDLSTFIGRWKSYTSNQLRERGLGAKCWQRSFYDHALRKEEDIKSTAQYIVNNPRRAGLVNNWQDYEHSWHMWMS